MRIQWVRLHDRAIWRRFSPGSGKLDFVCMGPEVWPYLQESCSHIESNEYGGEGGVSTLHGVDGVEEDKVTRSH